MRFNVLGSGSAGNVTVVQSGRSTILLDCGLGLSELERRAKVARFCLSEIDAIFITHEHDDHIAGVSAFVRKYSTPVFASAGTVRASQRRLRGVSEVHLLRPESMEEVGNISIMPLIVPHDALEPCQFLITSEGQRLGLLTDLGKTTPHLEQAYQNLDALILEFNHDVAMLAKGPYPPSLKDRVSGPYGHLSNDQARSFVQKLGLERLRVLIAAHLSEKNNRVSLVREILSELFSKNVHLHVAEQDIPSPWMEL